MIQNPDIFNLNDGESPDNSFENLYITGKLNYEFNNDDITVSTINVNEKLNYNFSNDDVTVKSLNVAGISTFTNDVTFTGDITLDEITARNANVTGIATVGTSLYLNGKLFDGDGDFGTAGQLLSSDGTDLNWIDASTTSVANANNVGTNVNGTNSDQFITFVGASSGNNPIRVDADLKYNPSTNTLSAINIAGSSTAVNLNVTGNLTVGGQFKDGDGNFGTSGQVLSSDGTDTAWINAGSLTAGAAAEVGVSAASANANHFVTMVDTASGNENIRVDTDLTYNPVTNTLNVPNISGNGSGLTGIESFVTGMIILWSGAANAIPSGFVLCNGSNSTPDLRNRFVVGAGDSYSVNNTGGVDDTTLSTSQLPSHNHSFSSSGTTDSGGSHFHLSFRSGNHGQLRNGTNMSANNYPGSGTGAGNLYESYNINSSGSVANVGKTSDHSGHQHGFSMSGNTGSTGSGSAVENRPPYYALCYIMKT